MRSAASSFALFAAGIPHFLRNPITLDDAKRTIAERLTQREDRFLRVAEDLIYGQEHSPYRPLLSLAGCELGDLRDSVHRHGLDATLHRLRDEGVYVSFEEFKGRAPIVRGGKQIDVRPVDFANPLLRGAIRSASGGTTGPSTQSARSLDHLAGVAVGRAVGFGAHGVLGAPTATWRERLPAPTGMTGILIESRFGQPSERWFAPPTPFRFPGGLRSRAATEMIIAAARVGGVRIPRPEPADYDEPGVLADWASARVRAGGRAVICTSVSKAMRVAASAQDNGHDLTDVTFFGAGEPPTPAKNRTITASGAKHVPTYVISEIGHLGIGCAQPSSSNDSHVFDHHYAIIQQRREVIDGGPVVNAFLVTTLLHSSPTIALNIESDDYGVIEERACGCALEAAGLHRHVRDVFSFSKLTGEGVTLIGTDLVHVLEDVLPRRFGGTVLDYQLVEDEDERGNWKMNLVISPRVAIEDESAAVDALLQGLGSSNQATELRRIWTREGTVVVRRQDPIRTKVGKHQTLVKRSLAGGHSSG